MLNMESLEACYYSVKFNICKIAKDMKCLENNVDKDEFDICSEEVIEEVSTDGNCGKGKGKCPSGQCCNKDGKCTETKDQCFVTNGCQYQYGKCVAECESFLQTCYSLVQNEDPFIIRECKLNDQGRIKSL